MMRALGELILADPESHSFLESIKKYLGKRAEFIAGWIYWACWLSLAFGHGRFNRYRDLFTLLVSMAATMGRSIGNRGLINAN